MEVTTLNQESFSIKCSELISKLNFEPDVVVGILEGGGFVINEIKTSTNLKKSHFEHVLVQRKSMLKRNSIILSLLKLLPYKVTNWLRNLESKKAEKAIDKLNLSELSNQNVDIKLNSLSNKKIDTILIVDDAIDTGKTMFIVKNNLNNMFPNAKIKTAVISWTIKKSIVKPDYYLYENILVRFPWSKDFKGY